MSTKLLAFTATSRIEVMFVQYVYVTLSRPMAYVIRKPYSFTYELINFYVPV
jgi:hypothetical protein